MSQSVTLPSSEKSGRQGISRIFRQSVRDLVRCNKTDAVVHRKESDQLKKSEVTEDEAAIEKKFAGLDPKGLNKFSNGAKEDAARANWPNDYVDNATVKDFRLTHSREGEKPNNKHSKIRNRCTNKTLVDFKQSTYKTKSDRNGNETCAQQNHNDGGKVKKVIVHNTGVRALEDWDKELQKDIKNSNLNSLEADVFGTEKQVDNLQKDFPDDTRCVAQTDINNNRIVLVNTDSFDDRNEDCTSETKPEFIKDELGCDESTRDKIETSEKVIDFNALKTEPFECQFELEITADEQSLPLHTGSTPKKTEFEGYFFPEVEKEMGTEEKRENHVSVSSAKQTNSEIVTGKKVADICSPESACNMRRNKTCPRSSDRTDRRNTLEFETPPRFKAVNSKFGNIEQADTRFSSKNDDNFHQEPRRYKYSGPGFERRGFGRTAWRSTRSKNFLRKSDCMKEVQVRRKDVEQKDYLNSDSSKMSLLEMKIETPLKFKSLENDFGARDSNYRKKAESPWKVPVLEDWSSEVHDLDNANEASVSADIQESSSENVRTRNELFEKTKEKLIHENQEKECETEIDQKYMDKEQKYTYDKGDLTELVTVESENYTELYLPPSPPVCWIEKDILVKEESSQKNGPIQENSSLKKEIVLEEESALKTEIYVAGESSVDQQNNDSNFNINAEESHQMLTVSSTQNLYLPPIPAEVIESGDEKSWNDENCRKYTTADKTETSYKNSTHNIRSCFEAKADDAEMTQEGIVEFSTNSSSRDRIETKQSIGLYRDKKCVANVQDDLEDPKKNMDQGVNFKDNLTDTSASTIGIADIKASERKGLVQDSSSLSSLCAKIDGACIYPGNGNMTSEADVSDLPFDESKQSENGDSGGFCCEKSVDFEYETSNNEVEQMRYEEESRHAYEQYARYWYEQNATNADYLQREQFGPWHPNYPYNYEAYRGWCEQIQMNYYYWEMYNRQMQYGVPLPTYWFSQPNFCQNENLEIENHDVGNTQEDKFAETMEKVKTEIPENRKERRKSDQSAGNSKQSDLEDQLENAEGKNLAEYRCERMHQWVKNQCSEVANKHDHSDKLSLLECKPDKVSINVEKVEKTDSRADSKIKTAPAEQNGVEKIESKDSKTETNHDNLDKDVNVETSCKCRPSRVIFMTWRTCQCEVGNPAKLHRVLLNSADERSLDLGYQSYESLEHEEPSLNKKLDSKAPGFVIQPLSSAPATQNSNPESCHHEKVSREVNELVGDKSVKNTDRIRPPPGFEGVVRSAQTEVKSVMDNSSNQNNSYQGQFDSSSHLQMTSQPTSLKSLIEQSRKYEPKCRDSAGAQNEQSSNKEKTLHQNVNDNNNNDKYANLPACLGNEAQHLSKACAAIYRAERLEDKPVKAFDKKVLEIRQMMTESKSQAGISGRNESERIEDSIEDTIEKANTDKNGNRVNETSVETISTSVKAGYKKKGILTESSETEVDKIDFRGQNKVTSAVFGNDQYAVRKTNLQDKGKNLDKNLKSMKYEMSSDDYCETSGDENIKFPLLSQSPQMSDNEESNTRASGILGKLCDYSGNSELTKGSYDRRIKNELPDDMDEEGEIPVNEMMECGDKKGRMTGSGQFPRAKLECENRPRIPYRPRSPFLGFQFPYRGGTNRPPLRPFSHMEQYYMDPRYFPFPPPPPMRWPPPSTVYNMCDPRLAYGTNAAWESSPGPVYNGTQSNYRISGEEKEKVNSRLPQSPPSYYPTDRDGCTNLAKHTYSEGKTKPSPSVNERNYKKLVQYDSSDESSSEIEPFDMNILHKTEREIHPKSGIQLMHMPKKLKTDTEDDSSSVDSIDTNQNENKSKLQVNVTAAFKLSRGHTKKLKQKTLKSFTTTERQFPSQKTWDNIPKKVLQDHVKNRTVSGTLPDTTGRAFKSEGRGDNDQEFPSLGSEQENQLPPLPPLPPFPNGPFWSMYTPGNSSALTGKTEEDEYTKPKSVSSTALQRQRKWLPKTPSQNYSFSPGQAAGIYSPSETDSETPSIRSDWKTNFKLFHNFGVKYIDTHCHLDFLFSREGFKGTFKAYMVKHSETFPVMFEGCVAVFCNPNTFTPSGGLWLDVAKEPNVWIAMGCHPKMATDFTAAAELGLKKCLRHTKCVALGEIGLDYSGTFYGHADVQKQVFRRQLKMAVDLEKVLVIHCRQAEEDCLEIMKEMVPRNWKIHCHCFTNEYKNAKLWIDAFPNLFIGVTPLVTYRTARPTHDLARNIPLNKLLLETDAPYFIPRCIPKEELPLSNPGLAITVAKEIAQYQELTVASVLRQCRLNTHFMYGI